MNKTVFVAGTVFGSLYLNKNERKPISKVQVFNQNHFDQHYQTKQSWFMSFLPLKLVKCNTITSASDIDQSLLPLDENTSSEANASEEVKKKRIGFKVKLFYVGKLIKKPI